MIFIYYNKCSTCIKAKKHLNQYHIEFTDRPIQDGISIEELVKWISLSNKSIDKFFNTNGKSYRENHFKDKLINMSEHEKLVALANDGMLIKRPILVMDDCVLVGYSKEEYDQVGLKYGKKQ